MEFQEKYKWHTFFSTGSTVAVATPYYPMEGYRRVDFLISGLVKQPSSGNLGGDDIAQFTVYAVEASNSTGGGTVAISSATAVAGVDNATGVATTQKCREGMFFFSTIQADATLEVGVGTSVFTGATSGSAAHYFTCAASAAATVACQGFVTCFNDGTNNTNTALTENWYAATEAAGVPWVRILPKDPDGTHLLTFGCTGSTLICCGGVFQMHIGIDAQHLTDGKTHVALKVKSTELAHPFTVQTIRECDYQPVKTVTYSKSLNASTSQ